MYTGSEGLVQEMGSEEALQAETRATTPQWRDLVEDYYERIFAFCFQILGNRADAEDATQDTFIRARKGLSELRSAAAVKSWLYRIARNTCIDRKRWWSLRTLIAADEINQGADASQELHVILRQLVSKLPKRQREVFVLRHWHQCSTAETAEVLGLDEGSVKSHLSRAVSKLKQSLQESETTDVSGDPS